MVHFIGAVAAQAAQSGAQNPAHWTYLHGILTGLGYLVVNFFLYLRGHRAQQRIDPQHTAQDDVEECVQSHIRRNGPADPF